MSSTPSNRAGRLARLGAGLLLGGLVFAAAASAQPTGQEGEPAPPPSLHELAGRADVVVIARVLDTDYAYTRDFPSGGTAFLQVLIPYKMDEVRDIIDVYDYGLHEHECYFPNPSVFEEGRRFLVLARLDPDEPERYRGLETGCALEVLVTEDNRYAVRVPADGLEFSDDLQALARPLEFQDPYARLARDDLPPGERDALIEQGWLAWDGDQHVVWTHGVPLAEVRRLMGDALAADLHTRRPAIRRPGGIDNGGRDG